MKTKTRYIIQVNQGGDTWTSFIYCDPCSEREAWETMQTLSGGPEPTNLRLVKEETFQTIIGEQSAGETRKDLIPSLKISLQRTGICGKPVSQAPLKMAMPCLLPEGHKGGCSSERK